MEENITSVVVKEKKKKSRSTKKSLAAENVKRQEMLKALLECDSLPPYVSEVLKEEEKDKGYFLKMDTEEIERFWKQLHDFTLKQVTVLLAEDGERCGAVTIVSAIVKLLHFTTIFHVAERDYEFTEMVIVLNAAMTQLNSCHSELKNEICQLCEYCCVNNFRKLPGEFYLDTVLFLLNLTLDETPKKDLRAEVKRMWTMHVALGRMNLHAQSCEPVVMKLTQVVVSPSYLLCKEGRHFIAFTLTLDVKFIKKFYKAIKDYLGLCKRNQAVFYGEIFYTAWLNSSAEIREALETQCIQNLMGHMFVFPRKNTELNHVGHNVLAVLSYLHHHRTVPAFSKSVTELYMPLLWRHLRSGNNIERCNASEVFLDVYPLEKPGSGQVQESELLSKQHSEMVDLLTDECHVVRIIAVKGICTKLCTAWETFPQDSVQVLMRNVIALSNDGSTYTVRRTLYESLVLLLHNPESAKYLCRILPSLKEYLHDENDKVRRAFVKMLLAVQAKPELPIKVWKIVSCSSVAARLEEDNMEVGSALSKLLMNAIYTPDMKVDKFMFRLMRFAEMNPRACRKLFQYSRKVLDWKEAVRVMLTILVNLRRHVKDQEAEIEVEPVKLESEPTSRNKRRRSDRSLEPIDENYPDNEQDESRQSKEVSQSSDEVSEKPAVSEVKKDEEEEEEDLFCKPVVIHTLVDIVSLLWSVHGEQIADPENEEDHANLLNVAVACIPLFLKYYKGSPIYYAVIHLASLVPANRLVPVSTACSACVSHLKQMSEVTPLSEIQVVIHALCAWNRFPDIQDVVVDWIDQAFRCEGLNQSKAATDNTHPKRKVRFVAKGGKPMLALTLLDAVFSHPLNSKRVLHKSYNHVYELYVYLERIKILVDRRMLQGEPFDSPMLSDEFLLKCLHRYSKLIILLHRPLPPEPKNNETAIEAFDSSDVFKDFIEWASRVVMPMIPQTLEEEPDVSVLILKNILRAAANLIDLMYAKDKTIVKVAEMIQGILSTENSLWFVESSMIVVKHIKDLSEAKYGPEDKGQLMRTVVPSLLSLGLKSLSDKKYSQEQVVSCVENLVEMKKAMFEVIIAIRRLFSSRLTLLKTVLKLFTDALIVVLNHDVKQLQLLDTVEKVQDLPFVCGLVLSIVCRPPVTALWMATIPSSIAELYAQESCHLLSTVSLLYTLAHSGLSLPKAELCTAVQEAHRCVTHFTRESTQTTANQSDSVISSSTESIDVKSAALPVLTELAGFLNCPLP